MPGYGNSIGLDKGYDAEAPLSKYRAVKMGTTAEGVAPITAVTDTAIGIAYFGVTADEINRGKGGNVRRGGIAEWEAGGVITRGDLVTMDSSGRCVSTSAEAKATLATTGAANAAITWTAKEPGTGGNAITVTLTNAGATKALVVDVANNGTDITVQLGTDGSSVITSTAQAVIDAVQANAAAAALVDVVNTGASTGAGLVTALAKTNLATGAGTSHDSVMGIAEQSAAASGEIIAVTLRMPGFPT